MKINNDLGVCSLRDVLVKTSSPFWEENREDEDEGCDLICIIETVFTIYDVERLVWILAEDIKLAWTEKRSWDAVDSLYGPRECFVIKW